MVCFKAAEMPITLENKIEYSKLLLCQFLQRAKRWNILNLKRAFGK